ncbi:MAG: hypothetical protein ACKPKO_38340, partial [Candidatus Fonsibacter sp.]
MTPQEPSAVLSHLLDFLDVMFLGGASHADGSKLLAACLDLLPALRGEVVGLERVKRALKGWANRAPAHSRFPPLEAACMAVIGDLLFRGLPVMGLAVLAQYLTYMRPG